MEALSQNICNSLHNFACFFLLFKTTFFQKNPSGNYRSTIRVSTVWTQIVPDILSGLIWVQTVYKGYQQTCADPEVLSEEVQLNSDGVFFS